MKSVLISIQPKWCEKIANGEKTVEVRKTRPKLETPFKCYIYCTLDRKNKSPSIKSAGKVIGEFVCDCLTMLKADSKLQCMYNKEMNTCMTDKEIVKYAGFEKPLYYWHISDLVIYDKPKELIEFKAYDRIKNCYMKYIANCGTCAYCRVHKSPHSWCYVEEV